MFDLERVYLNLPPTIQNLACTFEGWRLQRFRHSGAFSRLLKDAENRGGWAEERIREYRDARLRAFIRHCAETVPYYRALFRELGIQPFDIAGLEDLGLLPVLSKTTVQEKYEEFESEAIAKRDRILAHTSGTTGTGLRFMVTRLAVQEQWAIWWRYRRWHGIQPGTWCGYFGGRSVVPVGQTRPPFWRYNYAGRQILFSGYHMSPGNMSAYVDELRKRRPPWLHGYPSLIALLASYVLENSIDLGYSVRWITLGAENVLPQQVEIIERAFGIRPRQHYGMAEGVANISECERGALHVDEDYSAVEFVPNPDGPGYRIVGCNFTNAATPLLRYDVGDVVTPGGACNCGRPGRVIMAIDGRSEDYVLLRNGARLGRLDHIFKDLTNVREAQIYQPAVGKLLLRVVRGSGYGPEDENALLAEARKRVGGEAEIEIQYVDRLPRSRTGKLRFVISDVKEGKLEAVGR